MRCLVTGASGFVGAALVRMLLQRGHEVVALLRPASTRNRLAGSQGRIETVSGSLEDPLELARHLRAAPVDATFHLAWTGVTAQDRNDPKLISLNVSGALRIWEIVADTGCRHWIGVGSQAEYGRTRERITETLAPRPETAYGVAKHAVAILTGKMAELRALDHTWIRLFSAYGPGDDHRHLLPSVVQSLLRGRKPPLTGGEQVWDFLYVDDAARALCMVMESRATGVFNLAAGASCRLRNAVELLRDCIDPELPLGWGELPYRHDAVMHLEADISRLQGATGWTPQVSLRDGFERTIAGISQDLKCRTA